jgi:hypothetical protein
VNKARDEWQVDAPTWSLRQLETDGDRVRYLRETEEKQLLMAPPPHVRDLITVAMDSGGRKGELEALTSDKMEWGDQRATLLLPASDIEDAKARRISVTKRSTDILRRLRKNNHDAARVLSHERAGEIRNLGNVRKPFAPASSFCGTARYGSALPLASFAYSEWIDPGQSWETGAPIDDKARQLRAWASAIFAHRREAGSAGRPRCSRRRSCRSTQWFFPLVGDLEDLPGEIVGMTSRARGVDLLKFLRPAIGTPSACQAFRPSDTPRHGFSDRDFSTDTIDYLRAILWWSFFGLAIAFTAAAWIPFYHSSQSCPRAAIFHGAQQFDRELGDIMSEVAQLHQRVSRAVGRAWHQVCTNGLSLVFPPDYPAIVGGVFFRTADQLINDA